MGTGTLANNLVTLRITYPHGSAVSAISDNKSSAYSLGVSTDSGTGGWVTALYYVPGAAAGITQITVSFAASVADWHGAVMEYSGVATSFALDGTCSNHGTSIACGSPIATTGANDLVVASMIGLGGPMIYTNSLSTITPGGNFIFDAADTQCSDADEELVQGAEGSVTPSFTVTGSSESFNIVGAAFKALPGAGTNPTGMYVRHEQHLQIGESSDTQTSYFVSSGNLEVVSLDIGPDISNISIGNCTPANTWTTVIPSNGQGQGLGPVIFYLDYRISVLNRFALHGDGYRTRKSWDFGRI